MTPTQPLSYQFLDDNLDTSPIALRLLTTPTSPQQTPQTTPPTPLPTPSPLNTMLPPNTPPLNTPPPPPPPPPTSQHPMITRSKILTGNRLCVTNIKLSSTMETWVLVPHPPNVNIVCSMRLYKHKYNADGSLSRYKARLVANGRSQQQGIDCDETFSPVVKPATIQTVLSLAVSRQWPIHHYAIRAGFYHSKTDSSLFIFHKGSDTAYLLLYVDDIILTASSTSFLQRIISLLHAEFAMTDLDPLNYFLGISAMRTTSGIFLSHTKYATEILEQAQMLNCNPCMTPIETKKKLGPEGSSVTDPTSYRSLAGSLQYLTFTRLDLSYAVQQLCLYMHDPREPHLNAMKRVLCCPATRRSTSGYCVFLGDNLMTWSSKRQDTLPRSTTLVYCDNVSTVCMSANPIQHQRTKHIEIGIHFVRDKVAAGHVRVLHVPSRFQYADIFTKGLLYPLFADFRSSLSVRKTPAPTARLVVINNNQAIIQAINQSNTFDKMARQSKYDAELAHGRSELEQLKQDIDNVNKHIQNISKALEKKEKLLANVQT
ncbi:ribonuclease H-like domain-containing protein [Tanacetum coccineum]